VDLLTGGFFAGGSLAGTARALAVMLLLGLTACPAGGGSESGGQGRRLVAGPVKALLASADGAWLAMLDGCVEVKGRFLPLGTATCDLKVLSTAGGEPRLVARAVPTLPHGVVFAPEGSALAALASYDFESGAGTLVMVRDGAGKEVARGVTFHGFVPGGGGGMVAVAGGRLQVVGPDGVLVGEHAAAAFGSFELRKAADGSVVGLGRTLGAQRGALFGFDLGHLGGGGQPIAVGTTDFSLAPGGRAFAYSGTSQRGTELHLAADLAAKPVRVAEGARSFVFASDGAALAWISGAAPGKQGDLFVAAPGGVSRRLGQEVGEHRWASAAPRLAWLEQYDPRGRSGVLGVGGLDGVVRTFGRNVTDFELSADGAQVAFLRHTVEGGYSVDLWSGAASGEPRMVARGVFGFSFAPDGRWLYFRTRCTRNGDACDLERVATSVVETGLEGKPEAIAPGVKSFEFDPRDPGRILLTWQRPDLVALDFGIWRGGKLARVDRGALPGSIRFLGPDSKRMVFAVVEPKRAGVHVADLSSK
jgi:hypothetical protein